MQHVDLVAVGTGRIGDHRGGVDRAAHRRGPEPARRVSGRHDHGAPRCLTCQGSEFKVAQLIGSWQEADDPTVTTLSQHGSLESVAGGKNEFGTWQFKPWDATPAKSSRPDSAPNSCVLWLHWIADSGNLDLVYLPLKVTDTSIQLSYIGRGNTIVWQRTTPQ